MKSSRQIIVSISQSISSVLLRPTMHATSEAWPDGAEPDESFSFALSLDGILFHLLYAWADANGQAAEFSAIERAVHAEADCDCLGFANAFVYNARGDSEECAQFVIRSWQIVAQRLGVNLADHDGRVVPPIEDG